MVKAFIEHDEILMSFRDVDKDKTLIPFKPMSIGYKVPKGTYEIDFEFSTEMAKEKARAFRNSFRITILIVD